MPSWAQHCADAASFCALNEVGVVRMCCRSMVSMGVVRSDIITYTEADPLELLKDTIVKRDRHKGVVVVNLRKRVNGVTVPTTVALTTSGVPQITH